MSDEHMRARGAVVSVAVAAALLAPLLTMRMPYRASLVAQAAVMLGATLALLAFAVARKGWRAHPTPPRLALVGVALYAGAAVQGAVVALVRGNDLTLTAGQLLAMGLLPLAALAGFWASPALGWRNVGAGVVGAVAISALIQLVLTGPADITRPLGQRLVLPNSLSASGAAPLALLLAFALWGSSRWPAKTLIVGADALIVLLILGARIRSQWLVLPVGVATYLAIVLGRTRLCSRRVLTGTAAVLLFVLSVTAVTVWWWDRPRPNLATGALASRAAGSAGTAVAVLPAPVDGALRVRGALTCRGMGLVWIAAQPDAAPQSGNQTTLRSRIIVAGSAPAEFILMLHPRASATRLRLWVDDPDRLDCRSTYLTVERIRPALAATLVGRAVQLVGRPPDAGAGTAFGALAGDSSITIRLREMLAVVNEMRLGSWPTWLFGHGLGATFAFDAIGYDHRGDLVHFHRLNYIHNFFFFLAFKLGTIGTIEVMTALMLFVYEAIRGARTLPRETSDRRFLAAAAASWIAYIAWSAAAPEILDFRLAPFWGIVVALTAASVAGGRYQSAHDRRPPDETALDRLSRPAPI